VGIPFIDDAIEDVWDAAVDLQEGLIEYTIDFSEVLWDEVAAPILEEIFGLLGFDGETVYLTELSVSKLSTGNSPNNLAAVLFKSIINDQNIATELMKLILTGTVASANRYYEYGRDHYIHGLPTLERKYRQVDLVELDSVLTTVAGEPVTIFTADIGTPDADTWAKNYLEINIGYEDDTGEILVDEIIWFYDYAEMAPVTNITTVYVFRDLVVTTTDYTWVSTSISAGYLLTTHTTERHVQTVSSVPSETTYHIQLLHSITNRETLTSPSTGNFSTTFTESIGYVGLGMPAESGNFSISSTMTSSQSIDGTTEYSDIGYTIDAPLVEQYYYVTYYTDANPTLYIHWVYLAIDGTYPSLQGGYFTSQFSQLFAMPIVALRKNFNSIADGDSDYESSKTLLKQLGLDIDVLTSSLDESPSIGDIRDAFFTMSINLYTDTKPGMEFLYTLFYGLSRISVVSKTDYENSIVPIINPITTDVIYPTALTNTFITREGVYNVAITYDYITVTDTPGNIAEVGEYTTEYNALPADGVSGYMNSHFIIRWQFNESSYREIFIHGLFQVVSLTTTAGFTQVKVFKISDDVNIQKKFEIPLTLPTLVFYDYQIADALIYESLTLQIYAADSIYLEYYETEDFLDFISLALKIAAIVILVFSLGSASNLSAALWTLATAILIQYGLIIALEYILEHTDNDFLRALAIIAYVVASTVLAPGSNGMLSVQGLLNAVIAVTTAANVYLSIESEALQQEITAFTVSAEERQEEVDKAADLLNNNLDINYWEITRSSSVRLAETPTTFLFRTGMINPGVIALGLADNFVNNMLLLPDDVST